jgi:hypothetical protein
MDDSQFDAWTRRRFGRAMGGGLASLVGLSALNPATSHAQITTQAERCRGVKEQCNPDKKKQKCCRHLRCETNEDTGNARCCKPLRTSCHHATECCGNLQCDTTSEHGGNHCCVGGGEFCQRDQDCCRGAHCDNFTRKCV